MGSDYADLVVSDNPTSYWRLDDTNAVAADLIGNFDGMYEGAPLQDQPGLLGDNAAVLFQDNNDRIAIEGAELGFGNSATMSVEAWFRTSKDGGAIVTKMSYDASTGYSGWFVALGTSGPGVRFTRHTGGGSTIQGGVVIPDQWHHVVAIYDALQATAILYLDGDSVANQTQPDDILPVDDPLQIGDGNNWGNFGGTIDEVAIYEHVLTPAQVQAHYDAGFKAMGPP
jgi:hypothetical protein